MFYFIICEHALCYPNYNKLVLELKVDLGEKVMYEVCKKFLFDARVDLTFVMEMIVVLKKIAWIGGGGGG